MPTSTDPEEVAEDASAPPLASGLISRPRLVERLRAARDAPLLLITAPAGYGKTTLLGEWAEQDRRPSAWLTARRAHDDPGYLLSCIVECLDRIEAVDPAVTEALSSPIPDIAGIALPRLQAALQADRGDFTLVLDDIHCLTSDACFEVLGGLIECMPDGSSLVLAARAEPHLPLGRLRAGRHLGEVGRSELAMTRAESRQLLAGLGLDLDPSRVAALVERTEGWPAALYLAGLSLGEQEDVDRAIAEFAGDDRYVVDYLRDEFIAGTSEAELEFLTRTSVLDRMSGPLCDAVLEQTGSGARLRSLSRSNMLLSRLDHRDEWFRYHALLREMLASELRRTDSSAEAGLHRRASAWYAEREDFDHAISHAIASGETETAGELIWATMPLYGGRGRMVTIEHWLERFDDDAIASSPSLALTSIHCATTRGDGEAADRWIAAMQDAIAAGPGTVPPAFAPGLKLGEAVIARNGVKQMRRDAADAYELSTEDDPWRSVACFLGGTAEYLGGDPEAPEACWKRGSAGRSPSRTSRS